MNITSLHTHILEASAAPAHFLYYIKFCNHIYFNKGTEGWHVDGNTVEVPHMFTIIHCISANKHGPTLLAPLREIVELFTPEERYLQFSKMSIIIKRLAAF